MDFLTLQAAGLGLGLWLAYGLGQVTTALLNLAFDRWFGVARSR